MEISMQPGWTNHDYAAFLGVHATARTFSRVFTREGRQIYGRIHDDLVWLDKLADRSVVGLIYRLGVNSYWHVHTEFAAVGLSCFDTEDYPFRNTNYNPPPTEKKMMCQFRRVAAGTSTADE